MGSSSRIACRSNSSLSHAPTSSDACLQWHRYRPLSRGRVVCCMQPDALAEAGEWLVRAQEDLAAAERLLQTSPPLLAVAAYHAQQAGEKALKAFLAAHNVAFRSTHNLEELLSQTEAI